MNDAQHAYWLSYLRNLADLMRLRDWDIDLARGFGDDPTLGASITCFYGRRAAGIQFGPLLLTHGAASIRETLVHELMHAHTDPINEWVRLYLSANEPALENNFPAMTFTRELELLNETAALVIAPFLPLPVVAGWLATDD